MSFWPGWTRWSCNSWSNVGYGSWSCKNVLTEGVRRPVGRGSALLLDPDHALIAAMSG